MKSKSAEIIKHVNCREECLWTEQYIESSEKHL